MDMYQQLNLRGVIVGTRLEERGLDADKFVDMVLDAFDTSGDVHIDEDEFVKGMSKYISDALQSVETQDHTSSKFFGSTTKNTMEEQKSLVGQRKENQRPQRSWLNYLKAAFLLLLGTAVAVILAMPLIETVADFASSANISSYFISYIVIPFALNYRQAIAAITTARKKTKKAVSLNIVRDLRCSVHEQHDGHGHVSSTGLYSRSGIGWLG